MKIDEKNSMKVYLIRSNISGNIRIGYTKEETAKKNKKFLEHIKEVYVIDE